MESKCYGDCYSKLKALAIDNIKHAPNQIKGRMWAAIGEDEKVEPKLYGPIRYNIAQGMKIYNMYIKDKLSEECAEQVTDYAAKDLDFMIFVHAEHQCVSLFDEKEI